MKRIRRLLTLSPFRMAGGYLLLGVLWILLSDRLVESIAETPLMLTHLQTVKGWMFVGGSAALFFGLMRTRENQIETSRKRLDYANQRLQVLHRIFRHNIRNDLNVIQGNIDLIRDDLPGTVAEERLESASKSVTQILDMSEKLKILEQTSASRTTADTIDLSDLIRRECDRFGQQYPAATIDTELPQSATVYGDHSLAYAIQECLENAIDHHNGPIESCRITVEAIRALTTIRIRISDNGPGIPENELEAIRTGDETDLTHVSGVGLWLITWLCRIYNGEATFDSDAAEGTVITLEFPLASPVDRLAGRGLTRVEEFAKA